MAEAVDDTLDDIFQDAALGTGTWQTALQTLADVTGSRCGQLIGLGPGIEEHFNLVTGIEDAVLAAYRATPGPDPRWNPRVRAALGAPVLQPLAEADFASAEDLARLPHYRDFAFPWDIPYSLLANLHVDARGRIGVAVLRTERQGPAGADARRDFEALLPALRSAVRTQQALEGQGRLLLGGMLQAMSIAGFVLDRRGIVQDLTPPAERLVGAAGALTLAAGRLTLPEGVEQRRLDALLATAGTDPGPAAGCRTIIVSGADGRKIALHVVRLPAREFDFTFVPRLLVVASGYGEDGPQRARRLAELFELTNAESEVAVRVAEGHSLETIATMRSVAVGTVRTQMKSVLAKTGTSRQAELVAHLGRLGL